MKLPAVCVCILVVGGAMEQQVVELVERSLCPCSRDALTEFAMTIVSG